MKTIGFPGGVLSLLELIVRSSTDFDAQVSEYALNRYDQPQLPVSDKDLVRLAEIALESGNSWYKVNPHFIGAEGELKATKRLREHFKDKEYVLFSNVRFKSEEGNTFVDGVLTGDFGVAFIEVKNYSDNGIEYARDNAHRKNGILARMDRSYKIARANLKRVFGGKFNNNDLYQRILLNLNNELGIEIPGVVQISQPEEIVLPSEQKLSKTDLDRLQIYFLSRLQTTTRILESVKRPYIDL